MKVSLYQLTTGTLEQALAKLLPKVYAQGLRCCVVLPHEERVEAVNNSLWTLGHGSFLPHGSARDGNPENQPIWLTTQMENPNGAQVLILTQGEGEQDFHLPQNMGFDRCLIFFDGQNAQKAWKTYAAAHHDMIFWQQEKSGEWVKKDVPS